MPRNDIFWKFRLQKDKSKTTNIFFLIKLMKERVRKKK